MQRIVAGGTGFIGSHLVNHWLQQELSVTVIGRSKEKINHQFDNRVHAVEWQELNPDLLHEASVIVNLAGTGIADKRWTEERKKEIFNSRIDTTEKIVSNLVQLGSEAPPLLNASAIGVYGLQQQVKSGLPPQLDETTSIDWEQAPDFLSKVARAWEKATHPAVEMGLRVVNLRFAVVLDKKQGALPMLVLPFKLFMGGPIGTGYQPFSWITLEDVIRSIDYLVEKKDLSGPFNIVANCVQQREFAKALGKVLDKPSFIPTPAFLLKLALGDMATELLLEGQNAYPERLLTAGFRFSLYDVDSTLEQIF